MDEYAKRHSVDYDSTFLGPKLDSHIPDMVDSGKRGSTPLASGSSDDFSVRGSQLSSSSSHGNRSDFSWLRNPFKKRQKPAKQTARYHSPEDSKCLLHPFKGISLYQSLCTGLFGCFHALRRLKFSLE